MKHAASVIFRSVFWVLAGLIIGLLIRDQGTVARTVPGGHKIDSALLFVHQHYVDTVNSDSIEVKAINNTLQQLDPHSVYLARQQAQSVNERLDGSFNGLGIEYVILRDTMFLTQVYPGSPAARSGLANGDRIISVNNKNVTGTHITSEQVSNLLKGTFGTRIRLRVKHLFADDVQSYTVTRGPVPLSSLDAAYRIGPQTGYIKLSKFATTTDTDFRRAFTDLKKQGVNRLVLDLRGNRGGYLDAATALADEFLTKGKLIVYTQGAHEPRQNYYSSDDGLFQQGKLAILIDEYSASASEIVAGAIQDLDRGIIVGRRSFGKGLVQEQFRFGDGSAINLTVARYYTPSGRSIQKSYKNGLSDYRNEIYERERKGELSKAENNLTDSISHSHIYHTQNGKKVYGGGGIMPDIFVAEDTTEITTLLKELMSNKLFTTYTIDRLLPSLSRFKGIDDFVDRFDVNDNEVNSFIVYASDTLKEMDSKEIKVSRGYIKLYLKAFAARFKWGDPAYFRVINSRDEGIKKALAAVKG